MNNNPWNKSPTHAVMSVSESPTPLHMGGPAYAFSFSTLVFPGALSTVTGTDAEWSGALTDRVCLSTNPSSATTQTGLEQMT